MPKRRDCACRMKRPLWTFLILVVTLNFAATTEPTSSISCCTVCECKPHEVWCENRGLTEVPNDIPTNTRRLYLFNNNISSIPDGVFRNLQRLELLDLRSNQLTGSAVKPGVFRGLNELHDVLLSNNKLTSIADGIFSDVPRLVRLYLEKNSISTVDKNGLSNLVNLVELKLSNNKLRDVPKIVNCPKLSRLCLNFNQIVRLQSGFLDEVNLEQLGLSHNQLNQLPSLLFKDLLNMRALDLAQNRISRIPRIIFNMTSLRTLNFSGNPIAFIPPNLLTNLPRMKVLDVHDLKLTSLSEGFIPRRVYMNIFDISNNPWICDCRIAWLTKYMRIVSSVFVGMSQVRCSTPSNLRGRQLVTLHEQDLNCDGDSKQNDQPIPSQNSATANQCDALLCSNGASCQVNIATGLAACRCTPGWSGTSCDEIDLGYSTFTNSIESNLFLHCKSTTAHSVEITFPASPTDRKLSFVEMGANGVVIAAKVTATIPPNRDSYTIDNLKPATQYRVHLKPSVEKVADRVCEFVTTKLVNLNDKDQNSFMKFDESSLYPGQKDQLLLDDDSGSETLATNDNDLIYAILGTCLGVCIVFAVLGLFVCYRKKKNSAIKRDRINENSLDSRSEKIISYMTEEEVVPMVPHSFNHSSYNCSSASTELSDLQSGPFQQIECKYPLQNKSQWNSIQLAQEKGMDNCAPPYPHNCYNCENIFDRHFNSRGSLSLFPNSTNKDCNLLEPDSTLPSRYKRQSSAQQCNHFGLPAEENNRPLLSTSYKPHFVPTAAPNTSFGQFYPNCHGTDRLNRQELCHQQLNNFPCAADNVRSYHSATPISQASTLKLPPANNSSPTRLAVDQEHRNIKSLTLNAGRTGNSRNKTLII